MSENYEPISCSFHDELEILAMHRQACVIVFTGKDQATIQLTSTIVDVFSRDGEEFVRLADGEEIRLDRLISVDGKKLRDFC